MTRFAIIASPPSRAATMFDSTASCVQALRQFRLLTPAQLDEIGANLREFPHPRVLAQELLKAGWLVLVRERVPAYQSREYRIAEAWVRGDSLPGVPDRPPRVREWTKKASPIRRPPAMDAQRGDTAVSPNSSGSSNTHHPESEFDDGGSLETAKRRINATLNGLSARKRING